MKTIKRRRKESKTDYRLRFNLLKSEKPRLIIRKTNRYLISQIVISEIAQDRVLISLSTKELLSHGWPEDKKGSLKSIPACYLAGMLLAKKSKNLVKEVVLDIGMHRNIHGSRIYALVKGAKEAGLNINVDESVFPKDEKIFSNKNIPKNLIEKIKGAK